MVEAAPGATPNNHGHAHDAEVGLVLVARTGVFRA